MGHLSGAESGATDTESGASDTESSESTTESYRSGDSNDPSLDHGEALSIESPQDCYVEVTLDLPDDNDVVREINRASSGSLNRETAQSIREKKDAKHSRVSNIPLDHDWVVSIEEKIGAEPQLVKTSATQSSCSIYRAPKTFYAQDHINTFQPQLLSIGPYHYERRKTELQAMEEHKWRYLTDIVGMKGKKFLPYLLKSIKKLEVDARKCYSEEIPLDSNSFVEMLVLDGCFIVQLFRKAYIPSHTHDTDDPILSLQWLRPVITMDLLMLENQIPFFILQRIFNLTKICTSNMQRSRRQKSLKKSALYFFVHWHFFGTLIPNWGLSSLGLKKIQAQHLLQLLHSCCISQNSLHPIRGGSSCLKMIRSASEIKEAGIKFKRRVCASDFFDMKFENGEIEIPFLTVQGMTQTTFLNLIAFEQCYAYSKPYFTAYAYLMDCLINTTEDVDILTETGIIDQWLGCNEDVAILFNKIGKHVALDTKNFYFYDIFDKINSYYERRWPRLRATLKRDYFKNPWTYITSIAAMILLLFTFTQTFFTAFPAFAYKP